MEFTCSVCEYTSCIKRDVSRHINKKNTCGSGIKTIIEIPIDIICQFCNKKFSTKSNLHDHIKNNCKTKKKIIQTENKINLEEENEKLKQDNEKLKQQIIDIKNKKIFSTQNSIRSQARKIYKQNFKLICVHCKNSENIETCHIKPVKDFDIFSEIELINKLDNLIGLCPNCHKWHDHSKKFEVLRTSILHSFVIKHLGNLGLLTHL
jgi:cell division protein FtsB